MVRVIARAGVGDEDGMRACLAMCIGRLVQLRKASTARVVWVNETIYQRTSQYTHNPAHVHRGCVGFHHILQQVGANQLAQVSHRRQIGFASLREQCWPQINTPVLLESRNPDMIIQ
eukprot:2297573-Pleurochrysis_carterae.AAC.2